MGAMFKDGACDPCSPGMQSYPAYTRSSPRPNAGEPESRKTIIC